MALSREDVREQLRATVDGRISIEQLEDWLVANSWNLHQTDASTDLQELVWAVDHEIATRSSDASAVDALRRVLQQLDVPRLTVTGVLPTPSSCTASFGSARTLLHIVSGSARAALEATQPEAAS